MKLKKIISGGQTGADQVGLRCAAALGLTTGGWAPHGYMTEAGPNFELRDKWGLREHESSSYAPRTRLNAAEGDATCWFGNTNSPGYWCTFNGCRDAKRPFFDNPSGEQFKELADRFETINIAGNRLSKNPRVEKLVELAFLGLA